jgi:precorrin-6A synthase
MNRTSDTKQPRRVNIIGIGLGSPGHLTGDAVAAMKQVDAFIIPDKGELKHDLVQARKVVCETFLEPDSYRFITVADPVRPPDAGYGMTDYRASVKTWREERSKRYVEVLNDLPPDKVAGFLVWGDPAFYDSIIGIVEEIGRKIPVDVRVIPGISAIQALAAQSMLVLNRVASPIHITTGRRLPQEWSPELGTVVVMLDRGLSCRGLVERAPDLEIIWGAYLGLPYQVLRRGRLADIIDPLIEEREQLRTIHGWMMDTYILLIKERDDDSPPLEM